jgi:uncharacterized protein (TIRG00374 family)
LLSFAFAAGVITLLSTRFDLDWGTTWENIRSMNPWLYLLALVVYYASFVFRGIRWRMLALNATNGGADAANVPSALTCSQLIVIGWFVNAIAWLRLGDAYRAFAFAEDSRSTFSWSLGTVLAERMLDMATVAVLIFLSVTVLTATSDLTVASYILIMAFVMAFGVAAIIFTMKRFGTRAAGFLVMAAGIVATVLTMMRFGRRVARFLVMEAGQFELAYRRFHQGAMGGFRGRLPLMLALGLAAWLLEIARLLFVAQALDVDLGIALVAVVALGHAILSTVPTPGGVGVVEPGITGLLLLGLDRPDAVSVAIVDRSITYVSVLVVGGLMFLLRQTLRTRSARDDAAVTMP